MNVRHSDGVVGGAVAFRRVEGLGVGGHEGEAGRMRELDAELGDRNGSRVAEFNGHLAEFALKAGRREGK